jgi:hypothetical protein
LTDITQLLFVVLVIAVFLLLLHKVRRIHIASLQIAESVAITRQETVNLFGQIQALLALQRRLALPEALPPMRGWAGSPDFLLHVAEEVLGGEIACVVECSSGVSTLVVARCLQLNGSGHVYSLEHLPEYADRTRHLLARYGLSDWATVFDAPLESRRGETPRYQEDAIPADLPLADLLIVDGPPGSTAPLARAPALFRLYSRMAPKFSVLIDDADRPDEIEMVRRWTVQWPRLQATEIPAEKGLVRLTLGGT